MAETHEQPSTWRSGRIWKMSDGAEPILIVTILVVAMLFTRRKHYSIFHGRSMDSKRLAIMLSADHRRPAQQPNQARRLFGILTVRTPSSSRFSHHYRSRILVKFPFLVEMFYWALTFFFYRLTSVLAQKWYGAATQLWDAAENHGLAILELEALISGTDSITGNARWAEWQIQQWFLEGADDGDFRGLWLTVLSRGYSFTHITGTVGFIAFYYWYSPTFNRFATVRRTMSLCNAFALSISLLYPTMPPRFMPPAFGFVDTVNAEDAQSVWMAGQYVNKLASLPSMHFGYAFCIGCVFVFESGFLQRHPAKGPLHCLFDGDDDERDVRASYEAQAGDYEQDEDAGSLPAGVSVHTAYKERSMWVRCSFLLFGIFYPLWILLTIVATANHYFLDAFVAMLVVLMSFASNRLLLNLLPLEDWMLWALRLDKPPPTTGWRRRKHAMSV